MIPGIIMYAVTLDCHPSGTTAKITAKLDESLDRDSDGFGIGARRVRHKAHRPQSGNQDVSVETALHNRLRFPACCHLSPAPKGEVTAEKAGHGCTRKLSTRPQP